MSRLTDQISYVHFPVSPDRPHVTESKIRGFEELGRDWYYGAEVPFDEAVIHRAIQLNQFAVNLGLFETDAFPGTEGEIIVTVYWRDEYLEFVLMPDDSLSITRESGDNEIYSLEGVDDNEARRRLSEFGADKWRLSGFSAQSTGTDEGDGSRVRHSRIQEITQESQSLMPLALPTTEIRYVSMFSSFIPGSLRLLRSSSGNLTPKSYQMVAG